MMERELEERLRAEKATPTASSSSSSGSISSPLGGIGIGRAQRPKSSSQQKKLIMGAVKRSNSRKDSDNSGGKERRDSENSGGRERRDSENSGGRDGDAAPPAAKRAKEEESSPATAKSNPLGALAGLGDYSSSEEED